MNKRWMGCHSDYGFAQTPRGFYANLVYNPSFANYGECDAASGCVASSKVLSTPSDWHGSPPGAAKLASASSSSARPSVNIVGSPGRDAYVANRGLGNAGLFLEADKPYEFQAYVWQDATTTGFAELWNTRTNKSLARQEFQMESQGPAWGATWHMLNLTLTPSAAAECEAIQFGSDPSIDCGGGAGSAAHVCLRCAGELRFGLAPVKDPKHGHVGINVGYVSLMPGAWGRLADKVRKRIFFCASHVYAINDQFTKTGSGQTQGNHSKNKSGVFLLIGWQTSACAQVGGGRVGNDGHYDDA